MREFKYVVTDPEGIHARPAGMLVKAVKEFSCDINVFSSSGYLDVSVHRVPFLTLWIGVRILEVCSSGFPHSEISGSMDICSSPKLIAAYHVFLRLTLLANLLMHFIA